MAPRWIAAEAGERLRVWRMEGDRSLAYRSAGAVDRSALEVSILGLTSDWILEETSKTRVIWCGVPERLVDLPAKPPGAEIVPASSPDIEIRAVCGLKQENPPASTRGSETILRGFLDTRPDFDGTVCIPGRNALWAQISAGEVVSIKQFATGKMFRAMAKAPGRPEVGDEAAFRAGVRDALTSPETVSARMSEVYAVRRMGRKISVNDRLLALILGLELAGAKGYWLGREVALLATEETARGYALAFEEAGIFFTTGDRDRHLLHGLYLILADD